MRCVGILSPNGRRAMVRLVEGSLPAVVAAAAVSVSVAVDTVESKVYVAKAKFTKYFFANSRFETIFLDLPAKRRKLVYRIYGFEAQGVRRWSTTRLRCWQTCT